MTVHTTVVERATMVKSINANSYYTSNTMAAPYHTQVILSMHACLLIRDY